MTFDETHALVMKWGNDRGIIDNGHAMGQMVKLFEETTELLDAIHKKDPAETIDAIGDIMVVLTMICGILDLKMSSCYEAAYDQIKDRKGYLRPDGVFVKNQ